MIDHIDHLTHLHYQHNVNSGLDSKHYTKGSTSKIEAICPENS